jgi:hypothetical protein
MTKLFDVVVASARTAALPQNGLTSRACVYVFMPTPVETTLTVPIELFDPSGRTT